MRKSLLAVLIAAIPAAAQDFDRARASAASLRSGCGFDGADCSASSPAAVSGSETDRLIRKTIDETSGLSGSLLEETRRGESRLLQRALDESPSIERAFLDAENDRTWSDYYQDRETDAAVASWGSNLKAGYLKGTAAAYATFHAAPPVVDVVAGGALWLIGVVYGLGLALIGTALTGHL